MKEYHKIQSLYKRDDTTHKFLVGKYSLPEFEYLKYNIWDFTEEIDGTNIRVIWDGNTVEFRGKTDNSDTPKDLLKHYQKCFRLINSKLCIPINRCVYTVKVMVLEYKNVVVTIFRTENLLFFSMCGLMDDG